jgi:hypothetical protein
VREAALLDLAVRALPSHLDQERRRRLGFSFGGRSEKNRRCNGRIQGVKEKREGDGRASKESLNSLCSPLGHM